MSKISTLRYKPLSRNYHLQRQRTSGIRSPYQNLVRRFLATSIPIRRTIPIDDLRRSANRIDPEKFKIPGSQEVARYLKEQLREGNIEGLIRTKARDGTTEGKVQSFIKECGTRKYYVALASVLPADLRRRILEELPFKGQGIPAILEECDELLRQDFMGDRGPTLQILREAARGIDPEVFILDEGAMEIARYIRQKLENGELELLSARRVQRSISRPKHIRTFTQMCLGSGSFLEALASLIKNREVMQTILKRINFKQKEDGILSKCGCFNGIMFNPQEANSDEARLERKKAKLIEWANNSFGNAVEKMKSQEVTREDLRKLHWNYALVHYQVEPYVRFTNFCKKVGGAEGEEGWYRALKEAFGLLDEHIYSIRFPNL